MVAVWWYDESAEDQRAPHKAEGGELVGLDYLATIGVLYFRVPLEDRQAFVDRLAAERQYKNRDELTVSPDRLPNYQEKIKIFFQEHLHEDEEIRCILDGAGYFDVRGAQDRWLRIRVEAGDLIILPAGIYHRFTLDTNNFIHVIRLFKEDPKWTPINRPADDNAFRKQYLAALSPNAPTGAAATATSA